MQFVSRISSKNRASQKRTTCPQNAIDERDTWLWLQLAGFTLSKNCHGRARMRRSKATQMIEPQKNANPAIEAAILASISPGERGFSCHDLAF